VEDGGGGRRTEDGGRRTEDGGRRTEDGGRKHSHKEPCYRPPLNNESRYDFITTLSTSSPRGGLTISEIFTAIRVVITLLLLPVLKPLGLLVINLSNGMRAIGSGLFG